MISCKRAAELIALSLERPLSWRQRLALALHLGLCDLCRRFRRQMRLLQRAGRAAGQPDQMPGIEEVALPEQARERIKRALREQGGGTV
jgi:hypothetical protein